MVEHDASFDEWFHHLFPRAVLLGERMLGSRQAAEDVAAEACARAFASWPKVRSLAHRDAWVLRVTANLAIDATRHRRFSLPPVSPLVPDADDITVLRLALLEALRALPRRQREAVALRYLSGLSEADVAAALGVSTGAVKSHIHRGVRGLRSRLGDRFLEDHCAIAD